jgi:hypothetical protein
VARLVFIVARGAQERYDFLRHAFASDDTVQVILDRRRAERRTVDTGRRPDRRRGERRVHDVSGELARQGYAVIRGALPTSREA